MTDPRTDAEKDRDRIWDAAEGKTAMLVTSDTEGPHARPMSAILRPDDGLIWFLTDEQSGKLDEIAADHQIAVTFSDGNSAHLAFRGLATVTGERAVIEELWSPAADAFYPAGPTDPDIRVIRFQPAEAELWDSPGRVVALFRMAAAVATGTSARDIGTHIKADISPGPGDATCG